jgi:hypothetical protein
MINLAPESVVTDPVKPTNTNSTEYWDEVDIEACIWRKEHESILVRISDQALCYYFLTKQCLKTYAFYDVLFTLPVILISTISGTANFAQMQISQEYRNSALMVTGAFSLLGGVLHTFQQYTKISEKVEKFRHISHEWLKLHHFLKFELSRRPNERVPPGKLLKEAIKNFEKFISQSPEIPEAIIKEFIESHVQHSDFTMISKPEICDFLETTEKYLYTTTIKKEKSVALHHVNKGDRLHLEKNEKEQCHLSVEPSVINVLAQNDDNV